MQKIEADPRIYATHISVYIGLWKLWVEKKDQLSLTFFSQEVKGFCKIYSRTTLFKTIRELHAYGYINYTPSYNHFQGSRVMFIELK